MQLRRMNEEALVFELCDKYDDSGSSLAIPLDIIDMDLMDGKNPKEIWIYRALQGTLKIYKMKWNKFLKQTAIGEVGLIPKDNFKKVYKTKYREIEFDAGSNIESAVKELKEHRELVCGSFNGQMLYSDVDDIDSAYKKIKGKTKAECDEADRKRNEEYETEKRKHEESIPDLTKEWIEKGKALLDEKYHEHWEKCVPIRLGDLYRGMELGATLDIIKELNVGCELEVAKKIIEGQGHSGMSFGLVCSMVKAFCERGGEFVNYVRS